MKNLAKVASLAAAACLLLAAASASSASASWVAAKVNGGPNIKATTSGATAKRNGAEAKSCSLYTGSAHGRGEGQLLELKNAVNANNVEVTRFECGGTSTLDTGMFIGSAEYETVSGAYRVKFYNAGFGFLFTDPWGAVYAPSDFTASFTNGAGATPSTFTLSETTLGAEASGKKVSLSGTFTITSNTGGLITLTH